MPTQSQNNNVPANTDQPVLTQLGLSDKEAEIYQLMLRHGKTPASKILPETTLKRTTVYSILEDLAKKGIVEKDESGAIIEFRAKHPYALKEYLESRVSEIKTAESKLDAVLPEFISFYNSAQNRPGIKFYEGLEGIWKILQDTLTSKTEILNLIDTEAVDKYMKDINKKYVKERERKQIKKRLIAVDSPYAREHFNNNDPLTGVKLVDLEIVPFETSLQIYDNKVAYITLNDNLLTGMIISDPKIYTTNKAIFDFLWSKG